MSRGVRDSALGAIGADGVAPSAKLRSRGLAPMGGLSEALLGPRLVTELAHLPGHRLEPEAVRGDVDIGGDVCPAISLQCPPHLHIEVAELGRAVVTSCGKVSVSARRVALSDASHTSRAQRTARASTAE